MANTYEPEKYIDSSANPINLLQMNTIIEQMKKSVFKIYTKEKGFVGTGFLLKYTFPNRDKFLSFFVTCYHVLGEDDLKDGFVFGIKINSQTKNIKINNSRNIYKNKELDVTFIEIISQDQIDIKDCLEIDDIIKNNDINTLGTYFTKKSIYIMHHPKDSDIVVSVGLSINLTENTISHKCITDHGSSGSPILSLDNLKIVGIHCGNKNIESLNHNVGVLIKNPINEFLQQIIQRKKYSELTLKYKLNISSSKIKLFGEEFVNNNKDNCKMIIGNKEEELNSFLKTVIIQKQNSDILEVKLRIKKKLENMSYMFKGCECLYSIDDMCNFNTNSVTNMRNMFSDCSKLSSLRVISNWDTSNVTTMKFMFSDCSSLKTLPDISKWNISKVVSMEYLFHNCTSLVELPDISKWNTSNVTSMENLFNNCKNLVKLPDISKWNISKVTSMKYLFNKCKSLVVLPDLSNWNISNVVNIESMFNECQSLNSLPDISRWNTFNITDMGYLFNKCEKLSQLPDISYWNISKVQNIVNIFSGCKLLASLPDISNWNTFNIQNMKSIFQDCESLKTLPDISKWNTERVGDMSSMFKNCSSLLYLPDISKWNLKHLKKANDMFSGCKNLKNKPIIFEKRNSKKI